MSDSRLTISYNEYAALPQQERLEIRKLHEQIMHDEVRTALDDCSGWCLFFGDDDKPTLTGDSLSTVPDTKKIGEMARERDKAHFLYLVGVQIDEF